MKRVSTFSCSRKCRIKSPTGSSPRPVSSAEFTPRRRAPTDILVGEPPTYAAKLLISTNGVPTSLEYRSIELRPIFSNSYCFATVSVPFKQLAVSRQQLETIVRFDVLGRDAALRLSCRGAASCARYHQPRRSPGGASSAPT